MNLGHGPTVNLPPPSQTDAAALALCYAVLISMNTSSIKSEISLISDTTPFNESTEREAMKQWSIEISHLSSSALRTEKSTAVSFFLVFPMQVAYRHMDHNSPEAQRLEGLMGSVVCDTHGFEIGKKREWSHLMPGGYHSLSSFDDVV